MNNYPPGVTGNEPQIRGWDDEQDEERECGRPTSLRVFTASAAREVERIKVLLAEIAAGQKPASLADTLVGNLDYLVRFRVEDAEIDACPFVGEVTILWSGSTGYWDCPVCDSRHEEEAEVLDEPRGYYDY